MTKLTRKRNPQAIWSEENNRIIREGCSVLTAREVARLTGYSPSAVYSKARREGLSFKGAEKAMNAPILTEKKLMQKKENAEIRLKAKEIVKASVILKAQQLEEFNEASTLKYKLNPLDRVIVEGKEHAVSSVIGEQYSAKITKINDKGIRYAAENGFTKPDITVFRIFRGMVLTNSDKFVGTNYTLN